jgi:hypothetical protein
MKFLFNNITGQSIPIRNKPKPKNENKFFSSGIFDVNNFKRDTQTGKLAPTGKQIDVPVPVCLKMVSVE